MNHHCGHFCSPYLGHFGLLLFGFAAFPVAVPTQSAVSSVACFTVVQLGPIGGKKTLYSRSKTCDTK